MKARELKVFFSKVPDDAEVIIMDPEVEDLPIDTVAYIQKENKVAIIPPDYDLEEEESWDPAIEGAKSSAEVCALPPKVLTLDDIPQDFQNNTGAIEA